MTSPTLPQIVEGLTPAQKSFLKDLPVRAVETYPPAKWLVAKKLAEWNGHRFVATPLGLQVRTHLLSLGEGM